MTPTSHVPARVARLAPLRSAGAPFWGLMFFTFILYISPQVYMPFLQPLRLAMVSSGLAIILYLLDRLFRGGNLTVVTPPLKLAIILYVLAAASIPTSLWPGGSFELLTGDLWKSLLIFALLSNVVDTVRRMKLLLGSLACWGTFMAYSGARDFSAGQFSGEGRIGGYESALAGNPNDFAFTLNLLIAVTLGLFFATRRTLHRVLLGIALLVMTWGVITSFSRAGFLTLLAIGLVILIERVRKGDMLTVGAVLALVTCAIVISPAGYGHRIYSIIDFDADPTGSARGRYEGNFVGLELIQERPLLGHGLGMNGLAFVERGIGWTGLHNAYLQVGADLGIPALVVFVLLLWRLFQSVNMVSAQLRAGPGDRELAALTNGVRLALTAFTIGALFHPAAYHFYFFYTAGLAVSVRTIASGLSDLNKGTAASTSATFHTPNASGTRWRPARSVR
ncbi:MAG TPA: O-antigen ligase family protein [Methylomirabilota bacterium]|jgi:O-antigen ligase